MSYIPKVGEICHYRGAYKVKFLCMCDGYAVIKPVESSVVGTVKEVPLIELSPLKTPAEIERDSAISEMFVDAEVQGSNGAFVRLYDKGYRKQQVKPLSKSYALDEVGITGNNYRFMVAHGFIVEGGE